MTPDDLAAHARALLDTNRFLTLGTVDPDGRPWTSPVYFATSGLREFYWSSEADAVHSRNLTERPHVSMVVFDSSVRPYHGRALYAVATASEFKGDDLERGLQAGRALVRLAQRDEADLKARVPTVVWGWWRQLPPVVPDAVLPAPNRHRATGPSRIAA